MSEKREGPDRKGRQPVRAPAQGAQAAAKRRKRREPPASIEDLWMMVVQGHLLAVGKEPGDDMDR